MAPVSFPIENTAEILQLMGRVSRKDVGGPGPCSYREKPFAHDAMLNTLRYLPNYFWRSFVSIVRVVLVGVPGTHKKVSGFFKNNFAPVDANYPLNMILGGFEIKEHEYNCPIKRILGDNRLFLERFTILSFIVPKITYKAV